MGNKSIKFFENIGNKVLGYFGKNKQKELEKERIKHELQKDFKNFLEVGDALFCLEMMESGYNPITIQQEKLENLVIEKIVLKEISYKDLLKFNESIKQHDFLMFPFIYDYVRQNNVLDKSFNPLITPKCIDTVVESFMDVMTGFKAFYKNGLNTLGVFSNYDGKDLTEGFNVFDTHVKLFKQLYSNGVMDGESFMSFNKHLENTINDIKNMTSTHKLFNKSFDNIRMDYLENVRLEMREFAVNHVNQNKKLEVLKKINKISDNNIEKDIKNLVVQRNYSISQLEESNQKQIKQIENLTEKINTSEVNEFVEARLPVILEKYLSIDKEYRTTLKNVEGYNAQELMTQSLQNIIVLLNEKLENTNTDLISELSIEKRKLKVKA